MKATAILTLALCAGLTTQAHAADFYVSPTGSDSNTGTVSSPLRTIQTAYNLASAGSTVYVRGGVYTLTTQLLFNKSGTNGSPIRVFAYSGETPIIDGFNMSTDQWTKGAPIRITGNYNHVKGFEIRDGPEFGAVMDLTAAHNIFENLNVHRSGRLSQWEGKGIALLDSASNNLILNCDSHHNRDLQLSNADGFHLGSSGAGNILRGNRAWRNSDDGYDFWNGAPLLVEGNLAFENGYDDNLQRLGDGNGFKLGGNHTGRFSGGHMVRNNVSWRNPMNGFDENNETYPSTLYNNTSWSNGPTMPGGVSWARNYYFFKAGNVFTNNLSFGDYGSAVGDSRNNSWNLPVTVSAADFLTTDDSLLRGPRSGDGSLPVAGFLRLVAGSDLIDRGLAVGLPFSGSAPDLGAYEYASIVSPPPPPPPADTVAPVVRLTSPLDESRANRRTRIALTADASDNIGVTRVLFFVDGSQVCSVSQAPYTCSWTTPRKGAGRVLQIKAQAYDAAGNTGVSNVANVTLN